MRLSIYFALFAICLPGWAAVCDADLTTRFTGTAFESIWQQTVDLDRRLSRALAFLDDHPEIARMKGRIPSRLVEELSKVSAFREALSTVAPLYTIARTYKIRLVNLTDQAGDVLSELGDLEAPPESAPAPMRPFHADDHPAMYYTPRHGPSRLKP